MVLWYSMRMSETGEVQQPRPEGDQITEAQKSLREKTGEFFHRHRFTIGVGIIDTIGANILLFQPNIESVIFNTVVGAGGGFALGSFVNRVETRWERQREEKRAQRAERRRQLNSPQLDSNEDINR